MMAGKARLFGDVETEGKILVTRDPIEVKRLGREVRNFDEGTWVTQRYSLVVAGNEAKFGQHQTLLSFLLSTGDAVLVEASPVDTVWGVGLAEDSPELGVPDKWRGLNLLGFALMEVRARLSARPSS